MRQARIIVVTLVSAAACAALVAGGTALAGSASDPAADATAVSSQAAALGSEGASAAVGAEGNGPGGMDIANTLSDRAQATTIAFDALAFMTGSLCADSFYPPGKVADFFGFQHLRDNDATGYGHNTAFASTVGENVLYILDDLQAGKLAALAADQVAEINDYAYARFPLMAAFRRLLAGDLPEGSSGLSADAVAEYSAEVYGIDGRISFARAAGYADVLNSLTDAQEQQLAALAASGVAAWPDRSRDPRVEAWRQSLAPEAHVALMTYAGDLFSWYAGDLEADTYFCPERQGTYFGSFYMKDIPAMLSQQAGINVSIQENLTGDYGDRLLETLTPEQRATITGLVDDQRALLTELVATRRSIAVQLRALWQEPGASEAAVEQAVMELSAQYGELDGRIVSLYAAALAAVYDSLTPAQLEAIRLYREGAGYLNLNAAFGDPCSLSPEDLAYLYSEKIALPDVGDTDFFFTPGPAAPDTSAPEVTAHDDIVAEATGPAGAVVSFTTPTATDLIDPASPAVTCLPASGSLFALGTTTVTCSAIDDAGNTGTGTFHVTVQDTTPPGLSGVPTEVSLLGQDPDGAVVSFAAPTATDLVAPSSPTVSCTPAAGSLFAVGTTEVTCRAADAAGNVAEASFPVTVRAPVCMGKAATVWKLEGSGVLRGTAGPDVIVGRGGEDVIYGFGGDDTICSGLGGDVVYGGYGRDVVYGGAGNDRLEGGWGDDILFGGSGDDLLIPEAGGNLLDGGPGMDTVSYAHSPAAVIADLAAGAATSADRADALRLIENLDGSPFDDTLRGSLQANRLRGLGGTDTLEGRGGDDVLLGGPGSDWAEGGTGTDVCEAEAARRCEL